jgi:hypothetical protein
VLERRDVWWWEQGGSAEGARCGGDGVVKWHSKGVVLLVHTLDVLQPDTALPEEPAPEETAAADLALRVMVAPLRIGHVEDVVVGSVLGSLRGWKGSEQASKEAEVGEAHAQDEESAECEK